MDKYLDQYMMLAEQKRNLLLDIHNINIKTQLSKGENNPTWAQRATKCLFYKRIELTKTRDQMKALQMVLQESSTQA